MVVAVTSGECLLPVLLSGEVVVYDGGGYVRPEEQFLQGTHDVLHCRQSSRTAKLVHTSLPHLDWFAGFRQPFGTHLLSAYFW